MLKIDANWAAYIGDRKSTTGYCISLNKQGPFVSYGKPKENLQLLSTRKA